MEKALMRDIPKVWGMERVLVEEPEYTAKYLLIDPCMRCSLHYHPIKKETFFVTSGEIVLEHGTTIETIHYGETRTIPPGTPHRFCSVKGAVLLEISTKHDDADVVRIEPSGKI